MKALKKIFLYKILIPVLYVFLNTNTYAECKKEDINYYLDKGFTTDQVTALCSKNKKSSTKKEDVYKAFSEEYADEQDEDYMKKMRIERQVFFKSSLGANNIQIRRDMLTFHLYECAKDGLAKPGSDLNVKGCAQVMVLIKLSEVEVVEKEFKEKVFFGNRQILVKGNVKTKIVGGMDGLNAYDANLLKGKVLARLSKNKGTVLVPIKKGLNFEYALDTFKEIVAFHKDLEDKKSGLGGDLEIKDSDVKPENKKEYIIEKDEKKIKLSNDEEIGVDGTLVFDDSNTSSPEKSSKVSDDIPDEVFD